MKTIAGFATLISFLFTFVLLVTNAEARDPADQKRSAEMHTASVNAPGTSNMTRPSAGSSVGPGSNLITGNPGRGLTAGGPFAGKMADSGGVHKKNGSIPRQDEYNYNLDDKLNFIDDVDPGSPKSGYVFTMENPEHPKDDRWHPIQPDTPKERPTKKRPD